MWGSSITFQDYPLEDAIRIMADAHFTRVEMWKSHLERCRTPQLRKSFVEFASRSGIAMGGLNVVGEPYFRPFGNDSELQATLEGLRADIDYALSLGAHDVLIWEGVKPDGFDEIACMQRLLPRMLELLRQAVSYASSKGARLLVEPHPFTVGMNDQLLIALCDQIDSESFGVTYDFCHYGVGRPRDYVDAVLKLGPRIRHIHFSDSDQKSSELHFAPGDGTMDLDALLAAFNAIGYCGTLTLDLYGNPLPIEAAHRSLSPVRQACERLGIAE